MYSCLVALMIHVCRDVKEQRDSSQFASLKRAEMTSTRSIAPAEAVTLANSPVRQKTLIIGNLHDIAGLFANYSTKYSTF